MDENILFYYEITDADTGEILGCYVEEESGIVQSYVHIGTEENDKGNRKN